MLITGIRIKGLKPSETQLSKLIGALDKAAKRKGFLTDFGRKTSTSLHVSYSGRCFAIDTAKLGHNYRVNQHTAQSCKAGYKRTNVPTWQQRVEEALKTMEEFGYETAAQREEREHPLRRTPAGRALDEVLRA
jgi:hypothetical protein